MPWLRISMDCARADVEPLLQFLDRLGADSVSIVARGDGALYSDDPAAPEYWRQSRLQALFPIDAEPDILIACLRNRLGTARAESLCIDELDDQDWSLSGRIGLEPLLFGEQLSICPSWVAAPPDRRVLTLDPGLGFGTGSHPTTALCLDWLSARDLRGSVLVDYGCGSGILGLSAVLLGAAEAWLVDIDAQALEACRVNAERNLLLDRVRFLSPGAAPDRPADLLVANILLNPLLDLAPHFSRLVRPGASLALSGLLATQAGDCLAAYDPWFSMGSMTFRNEWALVQGRRRSAASAD
ncbi:MAG: ribosomal protein L11 methyltransferase [Gammaproteobacteria bacterium RIFCSPLOWO2_02_FULL_61_13]|nr:MAG: ribosomal protein L11 methyltransferase [Gammaproteobacteria bacterium RIFCSPLOWO2_02_FULL_61_13]